MDNLALYCDADPLWSSIYLMLFFAFACWILSVITGNCSFVDRLWSVAPAIYAFHFLAFSVGCSDSSQLDQRQVLVTLLVTAWAVRLTYNFARKGGYNLSEEDYRWPVLRKSMHPILFQLFNISFIAFYQNVLLLLFTLPSYAVLTGRGTPLNNIDYVSTVLFVIFLVGETMADQQQWNFQNRKHRMIDLRGFLTNGLFRFSRHPNFFCEQSLWWSFYGFSIATTGQYVHWTIAGTVLLTVLFQGSTKFTEDITKEKYPIYALYQDCTSRLIPMLPGDRSKLEASD